MATADDLGDEWWLRTPKRTTKKLKENEKKKAVVYIMLYINHLGRAWLARWLE